MDRFLAGGHRRKTAKLFSSCESEPLRAFWRSIQGLLGPDGDSALIRKLARPDTQVRTKPPRPTSGKHPELGRCRLLACAFEAGIDKMPDEINAPRQAKEEQRVDPGSLKLKNKTPSPTKNPRQESILPSDQFLANISHELRAPLVGILGLSELLFKTSLNSEQVPHLESIRRQSKRLLSLVNNLLDMSKLEAGQLRTEEAPFDLDQVMQEALATTVFQTPNADIDVVLSIEPDVPLALIGDSQRVLQVLINLIANARKFTEQGSIEISATLRSQRESVASLRFVVCDSGIGIAAHELESIFDPFAQAASTRTRNFGGTGLGLSICKHIVEQMGGHIWADSTLGQGSRFCFEISCRIQDLPDRGSSSRDDRAINKRELKPLRILLADDDPISQTVLSGYLEEMGHTVWIAHNGQEAVDAHALGRFDMILMDLQMPIKGGLEAAEAIRDAQPEQGAQVPIIILSASTRPAESNRCQAGTVDGYLLKPIDPSVLHETLVKHLPESDASASWQLRNLDRECSTLD